jgi:hypothetical protein
MDRKQTTKRKGQRSGSKPANKEQKRPNYVNLNIHELTALDLVGFRERWAYVRLKEICDWKAGVCGEHGDQRLSYVDIASMVTAPATQGRGMGGIDDTQAHDFLDRLEAVGLIKNIGRRANGGLRFDMPLALSKRAESGKSEEIAGKEGDISPTQRAVEIDANPQPVSLAEVQAPSLSLMINKELNISNDVVPTAYAGGTTGRAPSAAPRLEKPQAQPEAATRLSPQDIHGVFQDHWDLCVHADTPESQALYLSWAQAGITLEQLHAAMTSMEETRPETEWSIANLAPVLVAMQFDAILHRSAVEV